MIEWNDDVEEIWLGNLVTGSKGLFLFSTPRKDFALKECRPLTWVFDPDTWLLTVSLTRLIWEENQNFTNVDPKVNNQPIRS